MSTPEPGDKFTRTQEFTVTAVDTTQGTVTLTDGDRTVTKNLGFLDQLQPVPAPVVAFEAGQTVARLSDGSLFTITSDGYFEHARGVLVKSAGVFTSTSYRLAVIS